MHFVDRAFEVERDYAPLRSLLSQTLAATPLPWNWPTVRLDSLRYGGFWQGELEGRRPWTERFHVWEERRAGKTQLVAVVHPDGDRQIWFQLHPRLRGEGAARAELESAMLDWFAAHNRPSGSVAAGSLESLVYAHDLPRQRLLSERGWENRGPCDVTHSLRLVGAPAAAPPFAGYTVRPLALDDPAELDALAAITNLVFPRAEFAAATWYALANAPTWNENWAVFAADGTLVSFCTIWYDVGAHAGWFEPVGTHPDHRRRGLAHVMMTAALQRLAALGARHVYVDTGYDMEANRLYEAVGFTTVAVLDRWVEPAVR